MSGAGDARADLVRAYEGLEDPSSFRDDEAVEAYRESLSERTVPQAEFLVGRLGRAARVVEVGCGNGRLLIDLARRGVVEHGLGVDLAESRIAFARGWAEASGLGSVLEFEAADVLRLPLPKGGFSAAVCITGAFGYFDAVEPGAARRIASRLRETLVEGGLLCLELYPHTDDRRLLEVSGGEMRIWSELPDEDPWRFYLSRLLLDEQGEILMHEKTFVHRTTGEIDAGRRERLFLYSPDSLRTLLEESGYESVRLYEGWGNGSYAGGETMVATAVRP